MNLSILQDTSSSCQCTLTLCGEKKGHKELRIANSETVAGFARRFAHGHGSFLGPGSEKRWYGTDTYKPNGDWDHVAVDPVLSNEDPCEAQEVGNCLFTSVVIQIQSKWCFARLFPSLSSLSVFGAVADMCDELASRISYCSEVQGDLQLRTNQRPRLYQQVCRQRPNHF